MSFLTYFDALYMLFNIFRAKICQKGYENEKIIRVRGFKNCKS